MRSSGRLLPPLRSARVLCPPVIHGHAALPELEESAGGLERIGEPVELGLLRKRPSYAEEAPPLFLASGQAAGGGELTCGDIEAGAIAGRRLYLHAPDSVVRMRELEVVAEAVVRRVLLVATRGEDLGSELGHPPVFVDLEF